MSASSQDPHLANVHSDELIPPGVEEDPITCLDEIGLHRELDAAVAEIRGALGEPHARTDAEIRRAAAAWILRSVRHQLANARLMATGGPDYFFSVLDNGGPAREDGGPAPPPPAADDPTHADQIF